MGIIKIGVTGGRNYSNRSRAYGILDKAHSVFEDRMFLVVGDARGLDAICRAWAITTLDPSRYKFFPADWDQHGRSAGHIRNRAMLHTGLDILIVFPGGPGTADMHNQALDLNREAGMEIVKILKVPE